MTKESVSNTTHVMQDGSVVDPTADRDPKHWSVERDPPPDVHVFFFHNGEIGYSSYDPPKGFTAEELAVFQGAKDCLTVEQAKALIAKRDQYGSLELTGDARWTVPEDETAD